MPRTWMKLNLPDSAGVDNRLRRMSSASSQSLGSDSGDSATPRWPTLHESNAAAAGFVLVDSPKDAATFDWEEVCLPPPVPSPKSYLEVAQSVVRFQSPKVGVVVVEEAQEAEPVITPVVNTSKFGTVMNYYSFFSREIATTHLSALKQRETGLGGASMPPMCL